MNWKQIVSQDDADRLMDLFGGFHDGCIREAHLWTDHWVNQNLSMSGSGSLDTRICFLIQRQFKDPSAIELLFDGISRFNLVPTPDNYDSIIYGATFIVSEEAIYWSPEENWSPSSPKRDSDTWIAANKVYWRSVDWLGDKLHFTSPERNYPNQGMDPTESGSKF